MEDYDSRSSTPELPLPLEQRWDDTYAPYPTQDFDKILTLLVQIFAETPLTTEGFVETMDSITRFPRTGRELIMYASFLRMEGVSVVVNDLIQSAGGMDRIVIPGEWRYAIRLLKNFVEIDENSGLHEPFILQGLVIPDIFAEVRFSRGSMERIQALRESLLEYGAVLVRPRPFNFSDEDQCVLL